MELIIDIRGAPIPASPAGQTLVTLPAGRASEPLLRYPGGCQAQAISKGDRPFGVDHISRQAHGQILGKGLVLFEIRRDETVFPSREPEFNSRKIFGDLNYFFEVRNGLHVPGVVPAEEPGALGSRNGDSHRLNPERARQALETLFKALFYVGITVKSFDRVALRADRSFDFCQLSPGFAILGRGRPRQARHFGGLGQPPHKFQSFKQSHIHRSQSSGGLAATQGYFS